MGSHVTSGAGYVDHKHILSYWYDLLLFLSTEQSQKKFYLLRSNVKLRQQ